MLCHGPQRRHRVCRLPLVRAAQRRGRRRARNFLRNPLCSEIGYCTSLGKIFFFPFPCSALPYWAARRFQAAAAAAYVH